MTHNQLTLSGIISRAPETRITPRGTHVLDLLIAGQWHGKGNLQGEHQHGAGRCVPYAIPATKMSKTPIRMAEELSIGQSVYLTGQLIQEHFGKSKERTRVKMAISSIGILRLPLESMKDTMGNLRAVNSHNQLHVIGTVNTVSAVRYAPSGDPCHDIEITVQDPLRQTTHQFKVNTWNHLARDAGHLKQGDQISVLGIVFAEYWQSSEGHQRLIKIEAHQLDLLCGALEGEET